jgi:hypothetical protein
MPNHITTVIRCNLPVAAELLHRTTEEEQAKHVEEETVRRAEITKRTGRELDYPIQKLPEVYVDFAKIIPEPEDIFQGGCNGQHPHPKEGGGFYSACWYNWNVEHWGTKWNAYDTEVSGTEGDRAVVQFDTAWAHPVPVIVALSQRFPDETLEVMYADEDLGYNLGAYTMRNGEILSEDDVEPGSEKALELAAQIKYGKSYAEMKAEWGDDEDDDEPAQIEA